MKDSRRLPALDVSRLAGLNASGVICEIMNDDGTMSRLPELIAFAQKYNLKIGTITDLIAYRRRYDNLVCVKAESTITSEFGGEWLMRVYVDETHGDEHIALSKGDISGDAPVLVRMHAMDTMLDIVGAGLNDLESFLIVSDLTMSPGARTRFLEF